MAQKVKPWTLGRRAMIGSLVVLHVWGSALVWAVLNGREAVVIGDMFAAVCFGIFGTLATLVGGKGWKDFSAQRFGGQDDGRDANSG